MSTGKITLPPPAFAMSPVAWSDGQLARLQGEWRTAFRAFAYHPFVAISALRGDPPTQYRVDFRVRSLVLNDAEQLQYVQTVSVEIWLPPGYPSQEPLVRPLVAVFHPNFSYDRVSFATAWQSGDTLVDVVHRVGEYLAYRSYDPQAVVNEVALQWLTDNAGLVPLDARADFTPTAGGEPLGRISQFGPATLHQMRRSIEELIDALSGEGAGPNIEHVRAFGQQTRTVMRMFLEQDIPAQLRAWAYEFDQFALDLPSSVPSWEHVRRLKSWSKSMLADSAELAPAVAQLDPEIEKLAGMVNGEFTSADDAVGHIPAAAALSVPLLRLPAVFLDAATRLETLRARLAGLDVRRPPNPLPAKGPIGRQLQQKLQEADDDVEFARHTTSEAIAAMEPALFRAREEVLALRLIARWREYIDIVVKATWLEQHLAGMSDAMEGYFIRSAGGAFGPFQLEREVELGGTSIVVHVGNGGSMEVRAGADDSTLARGANGIVATMLPAGGGSSAPMTFKVAEGVDQPLLQLEYACKQTSLILPRIQAAPASKAISWCGRMLALFADAEAQQAARSEHRRCIHRWEALTEELKHLSQYKARLATYFLLQRAAALVPRLNAERAAHEAIITEAMQRITAIVGRSTRDGETNRLIVPAKFAKSYTDENAALESARKESRRLESRLKSLANRLRERLASPKLCGRPEVPQLRRMQPLSAELTELAPQMSDEQLLAIVGMLAEHLQTPLIANFAPPPETETHRALPLTGDLSALGSGDMPVVSEGSVADEFHVAEDRGSQPWAAVPQGEPEAKEPESQTWPQMPAVEGGEEPAAAESDEVFFATDDEEIPSENENDWIEQ